MPAAIPVLGRDRAALVPWVELLDLAIADEEGGTLVRLDQAGGPGDDIELGLLPLGLVHPSVVLEHFTAPTTCRALGAVSRGWSSPLDEGRPSLHPNRRRVTVILLVDRAGNLAGRLRWDDGQVIDSAPSEGEIPRLLRKAMGTT